MEEDVAGLEAVANRGGYAVCAECGAVIRRHQAAVEPSALTGTVRSEFGELCPDCERLDRQGEQPVLDEIEV